MKLTPLIASTLISIVLCIGVSQAGQSDSIPSYTAADLDMKNVRDVKDKKKRFFDFMRPIVNAENKRIALDRQRLLMAREKGNNQDWVRKMAESYSVEWDNSKASWNKLLERVDVVPLELVLAQSANESAWGQSRFAQQGNNFFGQWCYTKGCGIVPKKRDKGAVHEVAKFKDVNASVRSYLKNINTGRVYAPLREIRAKARKQGKPLNASAMAAGLIKYSQRRQAYVDEIRAMIRVNKKLMLGT
jgi:Bax protein